MASSRPKASKNAKKSSNSTKKATRPPAAAKPKSKPPARAAARPGGRGPAIKAPAVAAPTTFSRKQIIDLIVTLLNEADARWFEEVANQVLIPKIRHIGGDSFVQVFDER